MDSPPGAVEPTVRPRIGWTFVWLMAGEVVIGYGLFLLTILSLLVSQGLGMDEATLGLAFASISAGGFMSAFLGGILADRLGPRFVALTALSFTFVGGLAVAVAPNPIVLGAGEFLIGAAIAIYGVTAYAWINETLGERRGVLLGIYLVSLVIGLVAAGASIAFLLPYVASWRTFYGIAAFLALGPALPLWFLLPPKVYALEPRHAIRIALRNRDVRWIGAQQLFLGVFASGYSWVPLFLIVDRGYDVPSAAFVFVGSGIAWGVGSVLFGHWADRGWPAPIVALGSFGGAAAYVVFAAWDAAAPSLFAFAMFSFLWPAAANIPITFLGQRLGPTAQSTETGLNENLFLLGDGIGATLIGILATVWSLRWGMMVLPAAACILGGILFAVAFGVRRGTTGIGSQVIPSADGDGERP